MTQDAIVTQWADDFARSWFEDVIGKHLANCREREMLKAHFARFEAEIEAATIERCAAHFQAMHDAQPSMENYCFMTYDCIADDLRNLKGQTS